MTELGGVGVGRGRAHGPARRLPEPLTVPLDVVSLGADAPDAEEQAVLAGGALERVARELRSLAGRLAGEAAGIVGAQAAMAADPELLEAAKRYITAGASAEEGVTAACQDFADALRAAGGATAERAVDVLDIADRATAILRRDAPRRIPEADEPYILIARNLAPADTATLKPGQVLAFATEEGGPTSHTAIVARSLGIPSVVGVAGLMHEVQEGDFITVDADAGTVATDDDLDDPTPTAPISVQPRLTRPSERSGTLGDGTPVALLANIDQVPDARVAYAAGAEGIGLLRTESLYWGQASPPTIAAQVALYREVFEPFAGRIATVRVLDAGADKPLWFMPGEEEPNPALGRRGIRALFEFEHVLRDQLVALSQAAAATRVQLRVMAPMVATAEEAARFVHVARECGVEQAGVMVEVPALALCAEEVLEVCDFASIGTNDLTQLTFGADRELGATSRYQQPGHPAVLRLIARVAEAGARLGKPVGVCGEAAGDPQLAPTFVGLGVGALSMHARAIAPVREALAGVTLAEAAAHAQLALRLPL